MENLDASPGQFSAEIQDEPTECADFEDDGLPGILDEQDMLETEVDGTDDEIWDS